MLPMMSTLRHLAIVDLPITVVASDNGAEIKIRKVKIGRAGSESMGFHLNWKCDDRTSSSEVDSHRPDLFNSPIRQNQ